MENVKTSSHLPNDSIHTEARSRVRAEAPERPTRRPVVWVVALNLAVIAAAAITLVLTQRVFDVQSSQAATAESRFVTTEWALLKEIQDRTEQILLEKDREIASLRELQASIADRPELADESERIRTALTRAYAERETILQARLSGSSEALAQAVSRIEQEGQASELGDDRAPADAIGPTGVGLAVDEQIISSEDSATLAWFRQVVDQLRFGRTEAAQIRLVTDGQTSEVLRPSDYDRLVGLVTLIERQNTFLDTIAALEQELDTRDAEIEEQNRRTGAVLAQLSQARERIATLEQNVTALEERTLTEEQAVAVRSEMTRALSALTTERARSAELERALTAAESERARLGEQLQTISDELAAAQESLATRSAELEASATQLQTAQDALEDAELAFERLLTDKDEAVAEALATATQETFEATELLLDYLAGTGLENPEDTRSRILAFWEESQRYQELLTRARRLAEAGVADGRNDLPQARLVGVVTSLGDDDMLVESLTDVPTSEGTTMEIRSSEGAQPGQLLATARVTGVVGDLIQAALTTRPGIPRVRDLAYVVVMPERE